MRTLVIDRAPDRRELVASTLRKRGYTVATFADAGTALIRHEAEPAQLVVLACDSGIDCAATCLKLRDVPGGEGTVILVLAVECRPEDLIEIIYSGADDFLVPPINVATLTPRLMIAERTRATGAKHRAIISALPDLMVRIARDGTLLDFRANQLADRVAAPERVVGRSIAEVMPEEFAARAPRCIERALRSGTIQVLEYTVTITAAPQHFEARFVVCGENQVLAIVRNITEQKQGEQFHSQLLKSQKLESMGILAGGIAHDFNNLLIGILGNAALALRGLSPESPVVTRVEDIRNAAQRAAALTRQILAYSGQGSFDVRKVGLSDHVREISNLLATSIGPNVELELDLGRGLPAIEADSAQLQQLVMNLVVNGAEAVADQPGKVTLVTGEVELDQPPADLIGSSELAPGRYLFLEVADTGCGIDAATRGAMFDPFFTTKSSGRGLGLAAVLGIVRRHRAGLTMDSEIGRGTRFRVFFPVAGGPVSEHTPIGLQDLSGSGLILVVDDEKIVRDFARHALRQFGYSVVAADNGLDAVDLFQRVGEQVVLVVLDLAMPVMRGEAALHEMRRLRPDLPALLTSGFGANAIAPLLADDPTIGFLHKPFTPEQLAAKIKELLG